ncbi:putative ribonuclease H-like domain-containing protein, partial [Tanacetum coccineum]
MELENSQNNALAKLPMLKLGEYEMWEIRIKQYFQIQDYALWEVIENGNSWVPIPVTAPESGPSTALKMTVPSTAEEKICKKNDVKARSLLLMALPNEHQLTFNLLQKLVSRLAILGVDTPPEDLNVKFLRSLPSEWDTHVVVWMNKPDFETMGLDDLYNNFKIVKQKVKRTVAANNDDKNLAFLTTSSPSSTNTINTVNTGVSTGNTKVNTASTETSTASFSDATVYAFLSTQPQGSQLVHEDLEQLHDDDLEEMDLKWNMALLSMRARKFYQRTRRKIIIDGSSTAGYDKSKVECFNYHKMGHFARECRAPRSKDNRNWNQESSSKAVRIEDASEKAICAIDGVGFDWSDMAEDEIQANRALMAFTDSEVSNDKSCSKSCLQNYEALKKQYDDLLVKLDDTGFKAATYKRGLSILEAQVVKYKESEVLFSEEIALLKRSVGHKEYLMGLLKTELEKVKEEKEGFEFKLAKFEKSSKDLDDLLASQVTDKSKKGFGYNAVPSPHPLILNRPTPLDLSYTGLEEFKQPEVNGYSTRDSSLKPTTVCDRESDNSKENTDDSLTQQPKTVTETSSVMSPLKVDKDWKEKFFHPANHIRVEEPKKARENTAAPIIEDWVSDDEEEVEPIPKVEKKTAIPTATKKESVKPEKPIRRSSSSLNEDWPKNCYNARPINTVRSVNTVRPFSTARAFNTVRPSYTAHPKSTVLCARPKTHFQNQAQSTIQRPFYKSTTLTKRSNNQNINTGRQTVNTVRPNVNTVRARGFNVVKPSACWVWRPIKPNGASLVFNKYNYIDARGRSKHMSGNIAHLSDFKDFNGGYVTFGGGANGGRITGKGTIKTDKIDFEDVYFVKELKFNLFSVSQMCDKKNYVLFTDSECLVLSPNFKLPDESQILLKIPRQNNMYSFDMKNIVPKDGLTCLVSIREYVCKEPQLNGVAEERIGTLIEAARTMLADSKLPTTFWAEAVSTACYVQNRVLVVKPHNKTPYELFRGIKPAIGFMKPFGCHVTILNTLDKLGKFDGKSDEGFFVGYSLSSKAFRVYNIRTRKVQENLHVGFLENKPMLEGNGPKWLFDLDSLTQTMNYVPVVAGTFSNVSAGMQEGSESNISSQQDQDCIFMPIWKDASYFEDASLKSVDDAQLQDQDGTHDDCSFQDNGIDDQQVNTASPQVNTGSREVSTAAPEVNTATPEGLMGPIPTTKDTQVEDQEIELGNISPSYEVSSTPHTRIHKDHPIDHVIGDVQSSVQTRRMTTSYSELGFLGAIYEGKTHQDLHCLFACFLSQEEPKRVSKALSDPAWVEAMQEELLQFKLQNVWVLVDLPKGHRAIGTKWVYRNKKDERGIVIRNKARLVAQGHTQEEGIDYDEVFAPVARIEAIRIFLAYASYMGFTVTNGCSNVSFLYGSNLNEEVDPTRKKGIFISQDKYVHEILRKFNYTDVKSASTPTDLEKPLVKDADADDVDEHLYRSMIGSLMYLTASRQRGLCLQFMQYVQGLWYSKDSPLELVAYTDSDYAGATLDREKQTGVAPLITKKLNMWLLQVAVDKFSGSKTNCLIMALASPKQTAIGKDYSNPLMAGSLPKTILLYDFVSQKNRENCLHTYIYDHIPLYYLASLDFYDKQNMVAFLEKSTGSVGFHQIIYFITRSHICYALTKKPEVCVSFIKQFWRSTEALTDGNGDVKINATIDGHSLSITEGSLRRHLKLADQYGITSIPTTEIFEQLALMGYHTDSDKLTFQ